MRTILGNSSDKFIEKMQNEYKLDLLQLGKVAAVKYWRRTGADWDEIISDSKINVQFKINLDKAGRGNFKNKNICFKAYIFIFLILFVLLQVPLFRNQV